ncbi:unnamed protein product [Cuscuta epithymum]|uniref:Uncharacterized protein n=1 Tax=Cuscuta epithymum TaxID=186058 RepID=A0AAV0C3A8_9ASTE|nr:unnamed protein product [Cuscuta epithymum]
MWPGNTDAQYDNIILFSIVLIKYMGTDPVAHILRRLIRGQLTPMWSFIDLDLLRPGRPAHKIRPGSPRAEVWSSIGQALHRPGPSSANGTPTNYNLYLAL